MPSFLVPLLVAAPPLPLQEPHPTRAPALSYRGGLLFRPADEGLELRVNGRVMHDWADFDRLPPAGRYTFEATPEPGSAYPVLRVGARVDGVSLNGAEPTLLLGGSEAPLSALREIRP